MIRLLLVELTRLRARRACVLLLAAAFVVPALIFAGTAWNTRPVSEAELARVQQMVDEERQNPDVQRFYERCLKHPQRFGVDPESQDVEAQCDRQMLPQPEWYTGRSPLDLDEQVIATGPAVVVVTTLLLMLLGTTFVGHDWNSRSMSNQLLFEPRRLRVWAAKAGAVLLVSLLTAFAVLAAYWTGMHLLASSRDIATSEHAADAIRGQIWRCGLLAGFAAVGAYALTMFFRSTVATLGVLFASAIVSPLLLTVMGFPGYQRLMPHNNFGAIVTGRITYYDESACAAGGSGACQIVLTAADGAVYFGVLLLVVVVPSVLSFRRRDVP